eukprot:TRINITY_DN532_c0_g1_i3.p1 TRINITY_DN532_c0_g1~~TRINITY_DN532_c0_g1_i3.p1  ORF type:complete len:342 (-),score=85.78 TRINITY_DN532_c0_g1_i3:22-1047(-)
MSLSDSGSVSCDSSATASRDGNEGTVLLFSPQIVPQEEDVTDYEKERLLRMQKNRERLLEIGLGAPLLRKNKRPPKTKTFDPHFTPRRSLRLGEPKNYVMSSSEDSWGSDSESDSDSDSSSSSSHSGLSWKEASSSQDEDITEEEVEEDILIVPQGNNKSSPKQQREVLEERQETKKRKRDSLEQKEIVIIDDDDREPKSPKASNTQSPSSKTVTSKTSNTQSPSSKTSSSTTNPKTKETTSSKKQTKTSSPAKGSNKDNTEKSPKTTRTESALRKILSQTSIDYSKVKVLRKARKSGLDLLQVTYTGFSVNVWISENSVPRYDELYSVYTKQQKAKANTK